METAYYTGLFTLMLLLGGQALATESSPAGSEAEAHFKMGFRSLRAEDYPGALKCFENAIKENPRHAEAYFTRAIRTTGWGGTRRRSLPTQEQSKSTQQVLGHITIGAGLTRGWGAGRKLWLRAVRQLE